MTTVTTPHVPTTSAQKLALMLNEGLDPAGPEARQFLRWMPERKRWYGLVGLTLAAGLLPWAFGALGSGTSFGLGAFLLSLLLLISMGVFLSLSIATLLLVGGVGVRVFGWLQPFTEDPEMCQKFVSLMNSCAYSDSLVLARDRQLYYVDLVVARELQVVMRARFAEDEKRAVCRSAHSHVPVTTSPRPAG